MRRIIISSVLLLLTVSAFSKTQLLKDYDFDKGGYYILGLFSSSDPNSLQDSLGEFYTDDVTLLNRFKETWIFNVPGKRYACGYHYTISVCRYGEELEAFSINLNCNEIVTDKGYFYFDSELLRQFYGKLKKPYEYNNTFASVTEARTYRAGVVKEPDLILALKPGWTEYEGRFQFTYECGKGVKDCLNEEKAVLNIIEAEVRRTYPGEAFELNGVGGSNTDVFVEIICNKSLSDKFNLYNRHTESYSGKWKPYTLGITTYWTVKK